MKRVRLLLLAAAGSFVGASGTAQPPVDAPKSLEFNGRTEASATVVIRARVGGHLQRALAKEGATVKKGELLAELDSRPHEIELAAAKTRLVAAEAKVRLATASLERLEKIARAGVVAPDELTLARGAIAAERADQDAAQIAVRRADLNLSYTRLTSPIDGLTSRYLVTEGNVVTADATAIITVVSIDPLHVWFDVDERSIGRLRAAKSGEPETGVKVGFATDDGYPHAARLDFIDPVVSQVSNTSRCRVVLANPKGELSPGMQARVRVTPAAAK
jgi:RND family efflux transporter MFP subunit